MEVWIKHEIEMLVQCIHAHLDRLDTDAGDPEKELDQIHGALDAIIQNLGKTKIQR